MSSEMYFLLYCMIKVLILYNPHIRNVSQRRLDLGHIRGGSIYAVKNLIITNINRVTIYVRLNQS